MDWGAIGLNVRPSARGLLPNPMEWFMEEKKATLSGWLLGLCSLQAALSCGRTAALTASDCLCLPQTVCAGALHRRPARSAPETHSNPKQMPGKWTANTHRPSNRLAGRL